MRQCTGGVPPQFIADVKDAVGFSGSPHGWT